MFITAFFITTKIQISDVKNVEQNGKNMARAHERYAIDKVVILELT